MTLQGFNYPVQDIVEMVHFPKGLSPWLDLAAKVASSKKQKSMKKFTFLVKKEEADSSEDKKLKRKYCKNHRLCNYTADQCRDLKDMVSKHRKKKAKAYKEKSKKDKYKYNKHTLNSFFKKNLKKV